MTLKVNAALHAPVSMLQPLESFISGAQLAKARVASSRDMDVLVLSGAIMGGWDREQALSHRG